MTVAGSLSGQVALVTGGTRGLGHAIAARLAAEGASVVVLGRDGARAERVAAELGQMAGDADRVVGIGADVSDWPQARAAIAATTDRLGPVDIVVANAGIGVIGTVVEADPADWRRMIDANYLGAAHIVRAALPGMLERRRGDVIAIASAGGTKGYPEWSGYCATKWAVVGSHRAGTPTRAGLMRPEDVAETVMLQLRLPRTVLLKQALFFPTSEWH